MRAVIQRVSKAEVKINNKIISAIANGILVLLSIASDDGQEDIDIMVDKIMNLRLFSDQSGKMNLSVMDIKAEVLVVPQVTLMANLEKGRRPSFENAALPVKAESFYNEVINRLKENKRRQIRRKYADRAD